MLDPENLIKRLSSKIAGLIVEPGLSDEELARIQKRHGFVFPPDLRALLSCGLLIGNSFPNWRNDDRHLEGQLAWPTRGLLFDVEHSDLWLNEWGTKPEEKSEALRLAERSLKTVPRLIPVYAHRYICEVPHEAGNPVLSVWQADIIYYGDDLEDYFEREFFEKPHSTEFPPRTVPFWHQFTDGSVEGGL